MITKLLFFPESMQWGLTPQNMTHHTWATKTSESHKNIQLVRYCINTNFTFNDLRWVQSNCLSHSHYVKIFWGSYLSRNESQSGWHGWGGVFLSCFQPGALYLQTVGVDNLVADGALHEHEVKLVLLFLQCVLLPRLFAHHTHRRVRQNRLHQKQQNIKE